MHTTELLKFFQLQRQIFGQCPRSGQIFRLSQCQVHLSTKPELDWLQRLEASQLRLNNAIIKFKEFDSVIENEKGRSMANKTVKKFDKVFLPNKLKVEDSFGIFHPIDYVVFKGIENDDIKKVVLLDHSKKMGEMKNIQKSIQKAVETCKYEWITFRVNDNGKIEES